jgi:hypothetical protein
MPTKHIEMMSSTSVDPRVLMLCRIERVHRKAHTKALSPVHAFMGPRR